MHLKEEEKTSFPFSSSAATAVSATMNDNSDVGTSKKQGEAPGGSSITSSATKFLTSLLGTFLPVFDKGEKPDQDLTAQGSTVQPVQGTLSSYSNGREELDLQQKMILQAQQHEQQKQAAISRRKDQILGHPQPQNKKKKKKMRPQHPHHHHRHSPTPPQFMVSSTIHHGGSNLAVRTGYAQVNRQQQQQQQQQQLNVHSGQPTEASGTFLAAGGTTTPAPVVATTSSTTTNVRIETDKKPVVENDDNGDAMVDQEYSDFDSSERDYEIQSIRRVESENVVLDANKNSGGGVKRRRKQDLEKFCSQAVSATAKRLDRQGRGSITKENLYKHLWNLVEHFGIPVKPSLDKSESNKQMVLLLDAVCGSGKKQKELERKQQQQQQQQPTTARPPPSADKITTNVRRTRSSPPTPASLFFEPNMAQAETQRRRESFTQNNVLRSQSFVQQRNPSLQKSSSNEPEIITVKPHNPLAMSKFTEKELREAHVSGGGFEQQKNKNNNNNAFVVSGGFSFSCLLYTSPSPRDRQKSRMPSSA